MRNVFIVVIALIILSGCGPLPVFVHPDPKWMVPKLDNTIRLDSPISIWVAPVEGGRPSGFSIAYIDNEQFHSALLQTLNDSGIVLISDTNLTSKYNLIVKIMNQNLSYKFHQLGYGSATGTLEVQYNLQKSNAGKTVWQETHLSEYTHRSGFSAPPSDLFAPGEGREVQHQTFVAEGAARENIRWLIQKLSKYFSDEEQRQKQLTN